MKIKTLKIIISSLTMVITISSQAQTFTDFRFTAEAVGWKDDFEGDINNGSRTITFTTQQWIEDIAQLPATFKLDGDYEVKVGVVVQTSGITENDFRRNVVYTVNDVEYTVVFVSPQASGLPVIKIETVGGAAINSKEVWTNMQSFVLADPNHPENDISKIGATNQFGTNFHRIRGRGNTTWTYPKKPYRIRFRENVSLFGRAAHENWVLLAEYLDPTFLTTPVAFEIGRNIFDYQPFTNTLQHVHLYLNGRYDGLYALTEHRQASPSGVGAPGRVGIDPNEGWFVEMDVNWDEDPKFRTTNYDVPVMIHSPEAPTNPENSNNPFYDFIKNDLNKLCDRLVSAEFPENGYRDLIDMNTFIDYLMINVIVMNGELGHPKSVFAYKDKGGKISMGPLWDFDWAFSSGGTHIFFQGAWGLMWRHSFFDRFYEDPVFLVKYKERWNEKHAEFAAVSQFIDELGEKIRPSVAEDSKRWAIPGGYRDNYPTDHAHEVERMATWWNNRISWLNVELDKVEVLPANKNFGTTTINYSEISPQVFTLVAYGKMNELKASLKDGNLSNFEISIELNQEATGNGGYLATISVIPKGSLSVGTYNDALILSGENQGNNFSLEIPLSFTVDKTDYVAVTNITGVPTTATAGTPLTLTGRVIPSDATNRTIIWSMKNAGSTSATIADGTTLNAIAVGNVVVTATVARGKSANEDYSKDFTIVVIGVTGNPEFTSAPPLRAWIRNGLLHVTGLTVGEVWSVYSVSGVLVYQSIAAFGEADISLDVPGIYVVQSGKSAVRVAFEN